MVYFEKMSQHVLDEFDQRCFLCTHRQIVQLWFLKRNILLSHMQNYHLALTSSNEAVSDVSTPLDCCAYPR